MESFWKDKKIMVTGGAGFLGSFVVEKLKEKSATEIFVPRRDEYDLRQKEVCEEVVKGIDIIIHLAANVGGIGLNQEKPGELFHDNIMMGVQLMEAARKACVKKFVAIGTVCAYPKYTEVPFKEDDLWKGYPEETNAPYGLAKKMLLVQAQAYRQQYGFNAIFILPANLYGPRDNFDPRSSHVIPALIKKCFDAIDNGDKEIVIWGDGSPSREFLFVEDAAEAIVLAAEKYNNPEPVNIGTSNEITIKELVEKIVDYTGFKGEIKWDTSKPGGQPRRKLDVSRALNGFGFSSKIDFDEGLKKTIDWYRGVRNADSQKD